LKCPYWFFVNYNRKLSGFPDSNVIFFVATKKAWSWTGFTRGILLAKVTGRDICRSTHPPLAPRPLRTSRVEQAGRFLFFQSLLVDDSKIKSVRTKGKATKERVSQEARVLENGSLFQRFSQGYKRSRQQAKILPSARRKNFCILLLPGKSMASDGTRTAGFACSLAKDHRQQLKDLLL
jgi:hypothetical protein